MSSYSKPQQILGLVIWLLISFIAAAIGAVASVQAADFYGSLQQPGWAAPAGVFSPVWTTLYTLMGIAAWGVWRVGGFQAARGALTLFLIQLGLNALWSWLFFVWNLGGPSFFEILILWVFIVATLVAFWRIRVWAGVLLIPYLLWVSFAAVLCFAVWRLNPGVL